MSIVRGGLTSHLWSQAQSNLEWASTRFWEHIIRAIFTVEDDWVVASQQPPGDPTHLRRADLVVAKWANRSLQTRFILEVKKPNASQDEIQEVEHQTFNACIANLQQSGREQIYGMTAIGTTARLWVVHIDDDYLTPWIPSGTSLSDKHQYLEAHSNEGSLIEDGLKTMRKRAEMSENKLAALRKSASSGIQPPAGYDSPDYISQSPSARYDTALASGSGSGPDYTSKYPSTSYGTSHIASGPGSGPDYTSQNPSAAYSASPPLTFTIRERSSSEPQAEAEAGAKAEEHHPLVPEDAIYVDVTLVDGKCSFYHETKHYMNESAEWEERSVIVAGKTYDCFLYTGKTSGKHFWTYSLRFADQLETGKGKTKGENEKEKEKRRGKEKRRH